MRIKRLAILSVHTSPLAPMGGKKTGGMNVYIRELSQELGKRGIAVDIFTRRSAEDEPDVDTRLGDGVRVIYLNAGPVQALGPDEIYPHLSEFTARLIRFATLENARYDFIYSHYWLSGWVAQHLKEAWSIPFAQMFHTLGYMKHRINAQAFNWMPDLRSTCETEIINWADRIIAATPAEHAQLMWLYRARRRKIEIVPPGVNTERFHPIVEDVKQQLGYAPDTRLLLFVGRIEPLKAVDTIIQALYVVRCEAEQLLSSMKFAVIGGDPNDAADTDLIQLRKLVREFGLEDVVEFLGAKDQTMLPLYYAAATAVIMPSDYESFGMVALEAMASGTPVIASEVGGLAYLVRDNETGYLIPTREPVTLAQSIIELLSNAQRSEQMGHQASHLAQSYAWPKIADRLLTIFEDVLRPRSEGASSLRTNSERLSTSR